MKRALKRTVTGLAAFIVLGTAAVYGELVRETGQHDPGYLLVCIDDEPDLLAWTCEQVLRHSSFTAQQVSELNSIAGARLPTYMRDPVKADQMLALFLARGIDIDASDPRARNWTALHAAASGTEVAGAKLLLKHGASTDLRDSDGLTPLDLAHQQHQKHPDNLATEEMARLLEAAWRQPAR